jgi:hypothetical protein
MIMHEPGCFHTESLQQLYWPDHDYRSIGRHSAMHAHQEPSQATVPMNHLINLIIGQPTQNTTMAATSPSILARLGNTNRSANSIVQIQ